MAELTSDQLWRDVIDSDSESDTRSTTLDALENATEILDDLREKVGEEDPKYQKAIESYQKLRSEIIIALQDQNDITRSELDNLKDEIQAMEKHDDRSWSTIIKDNVTGPARVKHSSAYEDYDLSVSDIGAEFNTKTLGKLFGEVADELGYKEIAQDICKSILEHNDSYSDKEIKELLTSLIDYQAFLPKVFIDYTKKTLDHLNRGEDRNIVLLNLTFMAGSLGATGTDWHNNTQQIYIDTIQKKSPNQYIQGYNSEIGNHLYNITVIENIFKTKPIEEWNSKALANYLEKLNSDGELNKEKLSEVFGSNFPALIEHWKNNPNTLAQNILKELGMTGVIEDILNFSSKDINSGKQYSQYGYEYSKDDLNVLQNLLNKSAKELKYVRNKELLINLFDYFNRVDVSLNNKIKIEDIHQDLRGDINVIEKFSNLNENIRSATVDSSFMMNSCFIGNPEKLAKTFNILSSFGDEVNYFWRLRSNYGYEDIKDICNNILNQGLLSEKLQNKFINLIPSYIKEDIIPSNEDFRVAFQAISKGYSAITPILSETNSKIDGNSPLFAKDNSVIELGKNNWNDGKSYEVIKKYININGIDGIKSEVSILIQEGKLTHLSDALFPHINKDGELAKITIENNFRNIIFLNSELRSDPLIIQTFITQCDSDDLGSYLNRLETGTHLNLILEIVNKLTGNGDIDIEILFNKHPNLHDKLRYFYINIDEDTSPVIDTKYKNEFLAVRDYFNENNEEFKHFREQIKIEKIKENIQGYQVLELKNALNEYGDFSQLNEKDIENIKNIFENIGTSDSQIRLAHKELKESIGDKVDINLLIKALLEIKVKQIETKKVEIEEEAKSLGLSNYLDIQLLGRLKEDHKKEKDESYQEYKSRLIGLYLSHIQDDLSDAEINKIEDWIKLNLEQSFYETRINNFDTYIKFLEDENADPEMDFEEYNNKIIQEKPGSIEVKEGHSNQFTLEEDAFSETNSGNYTFEFQGEVIEISGEERNLLQNNPEAVENFIEFKTVLQRTNLEGIWNFREKIFGCLGGIGFQIDENYLTENEIKIFLNTIMVSVSEHPDFPGGIKNNNIPPMNSRFEDYIQQVRYLNKVGPVGGIQDVNMMGESYLEKIFRDRFSPRHNSLTDFNVESFNKAIHH